MGERLLAGKDADEERLRLERDECAQEVARRLVLEVRAVDDRVREDDGLDGRRHAVREEHAHLRHASSTSRNPTA
jgi:hypothetical protein